MNSEVVFGIHAVQALLKYSPHRILRIMIQSNKKEEYVLELLQHAEKVNVVVRIVERAVLDSESNGGVHQGVIAEVIKKRTLKEHELIDVLDGLTRDPFLLLLDGVTDSHNLGACLRSCDGAGVDAIIFPKNNSAGINGVVSKVACGALETVPLVQVTNLARTMDVLKSRGIWLFGMDGNSNQSIYQSTFQGSIGIVAGSENSGMRRLTKERCDYLVNIPMNGVIPSLNVSVAVGVCLFEVVRQKQLV